MLNLGLLSLIVALVMGVFGFASYAPEELTWQKAASVVFLLLSAAALFGGTVSRPASMWKFIDRRRSGWLRQRTYQSSQTAY